MPLPTPAHVSNADPLMIRLWQSGREIFLSNTLAFLIGEAQYGPCLLETLTGDSGWCRCARDRSRSDNEGRSLPSPLRACLQPRVNFSPRY